MTRRVIQTDRAPAAIGAYSQGVIAGQTLYVSGQIPLVPETMEIDDGDIGARVRRVFANVQAVVEAGGGDLGQVVKVNVYLTDIANFPVVNEVLAEYFDEPFPARAVLGAAALPKGVPVEVDAIVQLDI
ncbi:MAG: reactive intermediate/imine deaminase [Proteobacteria bacterium SW_6_67_9]|nr:MAG: reactive intermediate/imine deaminase [Proteobacteria bacterium SW_6_67_9]